MDVLDRPFKSDQPEHVKYFLTVFGCLDLLTVLTHPGLCSFYPQANLLGTPNRWVFLIFMIVLLAQGVLLIVGRKLGAYLYYISFSLRIPFMTFSFSFLFDLLAIPMVGDLRWIFLILLFGLEGYRLYMTIKFQGGGCLKD